MTWGSFAAVGDSFTEGLDDPGPDGQYVGWADRFADALAVAHPGFHYANLAVRGKVMHQVVSEQVPVVEAARPDLVSFSAGVNDILRPRCDVDALCEAADAAVARLRAAGCDVLLFSGVDPSRRLRLMKAVVGRVYAFNAAMQEIGHRHGCPVVHLTGAPVFEDPRVWSEDRLHLNADGHQRVADAVAQELGLSRSAAWRDPVHPAATAAPWAQARRADAVWARDHFVPWVARRVRRRSSGDGLPAKRPELVPWMGA